jgi:crotonobetainyl-CoA:carnitine CoA-transferase CaiB-like acyl-CoA transferase
MPEALSGVRVVERASGPAAAYAARLFAACGADVVMAEPPGGTPLRREAPFVGKSGTSALFAYLAAFKSSAVAATQADLDELLRDADVLFDDTPAGERSACGLDPDRIARQFPNLIFVSVLPFGAYGPRRDWKATELNSLHSGGEGYLMPNGLAIERFPERPPVKIYGQFASFQGGTASAIAALAALVARPLQGGQFVDVSIQDANVAESTVAIQRWADGVLETRKTRSFRYGGVLPCADGYVEVLTLEQHQWEALAKLTDAATWAKPGEFDDPLERSKRGDEINRYIRAWARTKKVADVVRVGRNLGVPIAAFASPEEVLHDPHKRARGLFAPLEIPGEGEYDMLAAPFQFRGVSEPAHA